MNYCVIKKFEGIPVPVAISAQRGDAQVAVRCCSGRDNDLCCILSIGQVVVDLGPLPVL